MVYFDFRIREKSLAEDLEQNLETADRVLLGVTYFFAEVRFVVNGTDMYVRKDGTKYSGGIQLLGFVLDSLWRLDNLNDGEKDYISMDSGWDIYYERHGGDITVSPSPKGEPSATVPLSELRAAFLEFKERVRKFLVERAPAIQKNPAWKEWFPENNAG